MGTIKEEQDTNTKELESWNLSLSFIWWSGAHLVSSFILSGERDNPNPKRVTLGCISVVLKPSWLSMFFNGQYSFLLLLLTSFLFINSKIHLHFFSLCLILFKRDLLVSDVQWGIVDGEWPISFWIWALDSFWSCPILNVVQFYWNLEKNPVFLSFWEETP